MAAATPSTDTSPRRTGFLDLAAELRLQIYDLLLPDTKASDVQPDRPLRADGEKCSTNFMVSCKQVYGEAMDVLYDDKAVELIITGWETSCLTSTVKMLGHCLTLQEAAKSNIFHALRNFKAMNIKINTDKNEREVCDVQDMLFTVLKPIAGAAMHQLHAINVDISISGGSQYCDWSDSPNLFTHVFTFRRTTTCGAGTGSECTKAEPVDLSRAHLASFLTDPLRTIRRVKDGEKKGNFTLTFPAHTGDVGEEEERTIEKSVTGDSAVPDYELFHRYLAALPALFRAVEALDISMEVPNITRTLETITTARIRRDVDAFLAADANLRFQVRRRIRHICQGVAHFEMVNGETTEYQAREVEYLLLELEATLPAQDADTSFFGYNESDDKLAAWSMEEWRKQRIKAIGYNEGDDELWKWKASTGQWRKQKKGAKRRHEDDDYQDGAKRKRRGGGIGKKSAGLI